MAPEEAGANHTADPTALTTQQLQREVKHLREWVEVYVAGETALMNEKLANVDRRFGTIEDQRVEQKADTNHAVATALSSAKEAVQEQTKASAEAIGKTETLTKQSLDQQESWFRDGIAGLAEKLEEMKERITRVETQRLTQVETRTETYTRSKDSMGTWLAAAALVISLMVLLVGVGVFK